MPLSIQKLYPWKLVALRPNWTWASPLRRRVIDIVCEVTRWLSFQVERHRGGARFSTKIDQINRSNRIPWPIYEHGSEQFPRSIPTVPLPSSFANVPSFTQKTILLSLFHFLPKTRFNFLPRKLNNLVILTIVTLKRSHWKLTGFATGNENLFC